MALLHCIFHLYSDRSEWRIMFKFVSPQYVDTRIKSLFFGFGLIFVVFVLHLNKILLEVQTKAHCSLLCGKFILNPLLKMIDLLMCLLLDNGGPVHNTLKDKIYWFLFPLKSKKIVMSSEQYGP